MPFGVDRLYCNVGIPEPRVRKVWFHAIFIFCLSPPQDSRYYEPHGLKPVVHKTTKP